MAKVGSMVCGALGAALGVGLVLWAVHEGGWLTDDLGLRRAPKRALVRYDPPLLPPPDMEHAPEETPPSLERSVASPQVPGNEELILRLETLLEELAHPIPRAEALKELGLMIQAGTRRLRILESAGHDGKGADPASIEVRELRRLLPELQEIKTRAGRG